MDKRKLKLILKRHTTYLDSEGGKCAFLRNEILHKADLRGVDLASADMENVSLLRANLVGAVLVHANLYGANLRQANLQRANLQRANLSVASLDKADLRGALLCGANLYRATLSGTNLLGASLPSPTAMLMANWGSVSDDLCMLLMQYDAWNHPKPELFNVWKRSDGEECPYDSCDVERVAQFYENEELWDPKLLKSPPKSAYELMKMVIREKCVDSDFHDEHVEVKDNKTEE